jgi:hypothetical protein
MMSHPMTIAERAERLGISVEDFGELRAVSIKLGKTPARRSRSPARAIKFTKAQVRRAVKGVESAGMRVRRVTVNPDGSITVDSIDGVPTAIDNREPALATSWDDV